MRIFTIIAKIIGLTKKTCNHFIEDYSIMEIVSYATGKLESPYL